MEKFVQVNTQELAKDKWLCPLSGKKFRGPEFVRKHIFNKHADKVEEVKTEVQNYLEILTKLTIFFTQQIVLHSRLKFRSPLYLQLDIFQNLC